MWFLIMTETKLNKNYSTSYMCNTYQTLSSMIPTEEESRKLFKARAKYYLEMKTPPPGVSEEYLNSVKDAYMDSIINGQRPATELVHIPIDPRVRNNSSNNSLVGSVNDTSGQSHL
jgi:hypothetical protein